MAHAAFDLIISDIDGCLSSEGQHPMDIASLTAIAAWNVSAQRDRTLPVLTLCSGRPQPFAEALAKLLALTSVPLICENGVWLYHPGTNEYIIDPRITDEHFEAVHDATNWVRHELGPKGVSIQPGKTASISLYHPDTAFLKSLAPVFREQAAKRAWPFRVSATWFYVNCDLTHVSKSTGIGRLLEKFPAPRERLAGIGDTSSDLAIRERVGWFACPANAQPDIKSAADFIASRDEAAGVVEILDHISAPIRGSAGSSGNSPAR